ncbi:TPA: NADH-quinone oxidoreductase subunit N [Candidatus Thalassarchaeaceae archaeon]|jgi:NADH-quinone oxidoreductase subunit N|nr:NADH-quinone oxidoreductase subunit N [Euryarchaeota archaeon]MDG1548342.1 NADH-quinone oxidoreductase subunit N [Candidatus Thalassarchaeaceae archaeon]DAC62464.1 MAG TPA: NADH-quinone oxidoreductase subunit N [Candidatus Poseidoniales archaeon]MBT3847217.1 NADH-quinone oxidoreductase subunit N [Euryarchaeota archaeon]MBT4156054.1 NADH-quinone oxidoreductase subunit N [Euryarchaeota archaeon]|tara:strand:+ start:1631 stop:3316 length:1686 start_codon:yes stop_codon:yes gene_type:complete
MNLPLSTTEAELIIPELIMLAGLIAIILIPNFGDASFRIPLSRMKVPILIGGNRFKLTSNPKLPNRVSLIIFSAAFFFALMQTTYGKVGDTLEVTPFSRLFTLIFTAALILATIATTHRIPARANLKAPKESDSENVATKKINALIDNRRQVDFHIILIMVGLGMSLMSMATHLFMLFVCIELASLSSYILVAFHKESKIGGEAGMKYFIVGSVASAIGIYGMSMLYLWNGDLSLDALASAWVESETVDPIAGIAVGLMLVAFGFKVGAAPFHLAAPDAYSGASSPVAGLLATASKAMGFVALMRILITVTMPDSGEAFWFTAIAIIAVVTMTWGNLAALTSTNPKRILAYSSVSHAGYMLAGLAAIGSGLASEEAMKLVLTAIVFHLAVLVVFKFGAFLVLSLLETEGRSHELEDLHGLARREPLIAGSMFLFMLSLAGVPPLSGFLSKFLMINGIVNISAGTGASDVSSVMDWITSVDPVFWLAFAIVLNSALSMFYYLRIGLVMFFEEPENSKPMKDALSLRIAIVFCALFTVIIGIGPLSDSILQMVADAIDSFISN